MAELKYRTLHNRSFDYQDQPTDYNEPTTLKLHYFDDTGATFMSLMESNSVKGELNFITIEFNDESLSNLIAALTLAKKYRDERAPS